MVARFGFFNTLDVRLQVFFVGPGRAVDTLQLLVLGVTAPVRTGHTHQLEHLQETCVRHVGATAHVHVFLVVVQTHGLFVRHVVNQAQLVVFTTRLEHLNHLGTGRHLLDNVVVLGDQLLHTLLDGGQVFRGEWALVRNVVIEALFNHRTNHHLGRGIQLLDGVANQVGCRVANDVHTVGILGRDDLQTGTVVDAVAGIHQPAVHLACHRHLGQARADGSSHFGHRHRAGIFTLGAVRECDLDHGCREKQKLKREKKRGPDRVLLCI